MLLDAELAACLATMPPMPADDASDTDYPVFRAMLHEQLLAAATTADPDPDVATEDRLVPGPAGAPDVRLRVYRPDRLETPAPALFWIHGGAFTMGALEMDELRCRELARAARCVVISTDYRLAPEHRFPAGLDDCFAALTWTVGSADDLGIDAARVAVGGASAGGALAAAVALRARDEGGPTLDFQLLVYPVLDNRLTTPSSIASAEYPIFPRASQERMWQRYLGPHAGDAPPYAAPARATDLTGLPPGYVMAAQYDPLRDEAIAYAMRLLQADVPTELHVHPGTFHGFEGLPFPTEVTRRSLAEHGRALYKRFHGSGHAA